MSQCALYSLQALCGCSTVGGGWGTIGSKAKYFPLQELRQDATGKGTWRVGASRPVSDLFLSQGLCM